VVDRFNEAEVDSIAERAADKAVANVYECFDPLYPQKLFWFIGVAVVGMLMAPAGVGAPGQ